MTPCCDAVLRRYAGFESVVTFANVVVGLTVTAGFESVGGLESVVTVFGFTAIRTVRHVFFPFFTVQTFFVVNFVAAEA